MSVYLLTPNVGQQMDALDRFNNPCLEYCLLNHLLSILYGLLFASTPDDSARLVKLVDRLFLPSGSPV